MTTRIITFLVGNPNQNLHLPLLLGGGPIQCINPVNNGINFQPQLVFTPDFRPINGHSKASKSLPPYILFSSLLRSFVPKATTPPSPSRLQGRDNGCDQHSQSHHKSKDPDKLCRLPEGFKAGWMNGWMDD